MKAILQKLDIDETFTKPIINKKKKVYTKVKSIIPLVKGWNYSADVIELPKTKEGYDRLLTMCDLATGAFDIEPMTLNKNAEYTLKAMKEMFKRNYIKEPKYSISTDAGVEFGGQFENYLIKNGIYRKEALPNRHNQQATVERLHRELGRLIIGYLNTKEKKTGHVNREWLSIIPTIRTELNNFRTDKTITASTDKWFDMDKTSKTYNLESHPEPKFKVGDLVHRQLDYSSNINQKRQYGGFRTGDYRFEQIPRKIINVLIYPQPVPYRYILSDLKKASFTESQLKMSEEEEQKFFVKEFIGKKTEKKILYLLVWYEKELKKDASWEPATNLIEDLGEEVYQEHLKEYERKHSKLLKNRK